MSRKRNSIGVDPFGALDAATLDSVSGGRTVKASASGGTDPALLQGIQGLVKAFGSINDNLSAAKKSNDQQAMQMVMQMMQGGGK
jgi:hypothetical protein